MAEIQNKKIMAQMYDFSKVEKYYKIVSGFLFSSTTLVRSDTIENHTELVIKTPKMPDKIFVNGEEYELNKLKN